VSLDPACAGLYRDLNAISSWLALDTFSGAQHETPHAEHLRVIVLLGNQVIPTLTAACRLAHAYPHARLLFSGGLGHATRLLYDNLAASDFAPLLHAGLITPSQGEAQMYAAVARHAFSIPTARIVVETQSTNGGENARFSLRILQQAGLASSPVLLLQDPLMQRRSVLTWEAEAQRAGILSPAFSHPAFSPQVEPGPEPGSGNLPQLVSPHSTGTWTFARYNGLLLGEMARLHDDENGYGPRGKNFIPHIDIPAAVWESYQRVLASPIGRLATR
jgi:uncharacterized SAM-binding protein YcdF (DUF218 family)